MPKISTDTLNLILPQEPTTRVGDKKHTSAPNGLKFLLASTFRRFLTAEYLLAGITASMTLEAMPVERALALHEQGPIPCRYHSSPVFPSSHHFL